MALQQNLVSVLTPVYNGAAFLDACIESVLRQTYENFEFVIVDNCSTDDSYAIAKAAADRDSRIAVVQGENHVGPIQNWNRALRQISQKSKYVKFVHADDWLFDTCIEKMLSVAECNSSIGMVSAYRLEEDRVSLDRLPRAAPVKPGFDSFAMDGRAVARAILLERASVLGSPTALLFRTDILGKANEFFATEYLHADKDAALRVLDQADFGFVQQVLTFTRRHNESVTSLTNTLDTRRQENLLFLRKYGPRFLSEEEFQGTWGREVRRYYQFLARKSGTGQSPEFWDSHQRNLTKAGIPFDRMKLRRAYCRRWLNPIRAWREQKLELLSSKSTGDDRVHGFLNLSRSGRPAND